ncbi:MAG: hypothetical protein GF350_14000, partial [Chitinivibrionales bacterium]|nr:hypothetical protein [Chitinivibrionales bacterium]
MDCIVQEKAIKTGISAATFLVLLVSIQSAQCKDRAENLSAGGYYKNFFTVIDSPSFKDFPETGTALIGAVNNRVRITASFSPVSWFFLETAWDFSPRVQDRSLFAAESFLPDPGGSTYRLADFDERLYPDDEEKIHNVAVYHNLDRLATTFKPSFADVIIGRQPVAWGSARLINPIDIIAPFDFTALDREDRTGVDACRIRIPVGMLSEIDAGYVFGVDAAFGKSAFFLKGALYVMQTDITLLAAGFQENLLVGFDLARAIGGAGAWCEAGYTLAGLLSDTPRTGTYDYFRISAGADYNFTRKIYGFAEYHFSSAGKADPEDYISFTITADGPAQSMQDMVTLTMGPAYGEGT